MLDAAAVHARVAGRWPEILVALDIPQAALTKQHGPCPACGGKDRFRFDNKLGPGTFFCRRCGPGDAFTLLQRVFGWDFQTALARVKEVAGISEDDSPSGVRKHRAEAKPGRPRDWSAKAELIWSRTRTLRGTLGEIYLKHRNCVLPPEDSDLRYLPPNGEYPPTLCACVTDARTARPISLHFTRLAADGRGKAGTETDKILLAGHRKAAGVIRLYPDEAVTFGLGIGEGIETCLAAAWGFTPVWSALDAGNLAALPVLAGIEALIIFADHDEAGLHGAELCADRWANQAQVTIAYPDDPGTDMADLVADTAAA